MAQAISDKTLRAILKGRAPGGVKLTKDGRGEMVDANQPGFGVRWNGNRVRIRAFARFGVANILSAEPSALGSR